MLALYSLWSVTSGLCAKDDVAGEAEGANFQVFS